jgi:hypothetical protein
LESLLYREALMPHCIARDVIIPPIITVSDLYPRLDPIDDLIGQLALWFESAEFKNTVRGDFKVSVGNKSLYHRLASFIFEWFLGLEIKNFRRSFVRVMEACNKA